MTFVEKFVHVEIESRKLNIASAHRVYKAR